MSHGWEKIEELLLAPLSEKRQKRIGIEIERIGLWPEGDVFHYEGESGKPGARQLLESLSQENGWPAIRDSSGAPLVLDSPFGKVSLEPGSQLELSTPPWASVSEVAKCVSGFDEKLNRVVQSWGLQFFGIGLHPFAAPFQIPIIPSERYHIMDAYLRPQGSVSSSVGQLSHHMMRITGSIQLNFDYSSEAEGVEMLQTALMMAPVAYSIFANSPLLVGGSSGYLSYRAEIWRNMDSDRSGLLPEAHTDSFGFRDYAQIAWKRPLMFVQDNSGSYIAAKGYSLEQITSGALLNVTANFNNLMNSLRELFFEARLKPGYVEVRCIDGLPTQYRHAATAFWVGLMYSPAIRQWIRQTLGKLSNESRHALWVEASKLGLKAQVSGFNLIPFLEELLDKINSSLEERGYAEATYLRPLVQLFTSRRTLAETWPKVGGDKSKLVSFLSALEQTP